VLTFTHPGTRVHSRCEWTSGGSLHFCVLPNVRLPELLVAFLSTLDNGLFLGDEIVRSQPIKPEAALLRILQKEVGCIVAEEARGQDLIGVIAVGRTIRKEVVSAERQSIPKRLSPVESQY
jgi:hypothetical protein